MAGWFHCLIKKNSNWRQVKSQDYSVLDIYLIPEPSISSRISRTSCQWSSDVKRSLLIREAWNGWSPVYWEIPLDTDVGTALTLSSAGLKATLNLGGGLHRKNKEHFHLIHVPQRIQNKEECDKWTSNVYRYVLITHVCSLCVNT